MDNSIIISRLRRFLLMLTAFSFVGTVFELWLTEHTGEWRQWIPFLL